MPKGNVSWHNFGGKRYWLVKQKNTKREADKYVKQLWAKGYLARAYPRKAMDGSTIYLIYKA